MPHDFGKDDIIRENKNIHNLERDGSFNFESISFSPSEKENKKEQVEPKAAPSDQASFDLPKKNKLLDFQDSVKISDKTALNKNDEVLLEITEAIQNPGGLFSFSFVEYTIETHPFGWNVLRKEQDFKRFRDYMVKKFPQFVIPPLLQTKLLEAQADIETKKTYFQEFLREIIRNKEL
jgi:hypothetical protein